MPPIFHGNDEGTHEAFQTWRRENPNGFHMTEKAKGSFIIHWTQDRRQNADGRGCKHQGINTIKYLEDKDSCYTKARKVCSESLPELLLWAANQGYTARPCAHCSTKTFPFPSTQQAG